MLFTVNIFECYSIFPSMWWWILLITESIRRAELRSTELSSQTTKRAQVAETSGVSCCLPCYKITPYQSANIFCVIISLQPEFHFLSIPCSVVSSFCYWTKRKEWRGPLMTHRVKAEDEWGVGYLTGSRVWSKQLHQHGSVRGLCYKG